jgi:S-DNA-T family DNA segregation ATPase FtsK/SpoIIIE
MREAALWVLGAVALIMLVALLSYSGQDPGYSHTGDGAPLRNQIGAIGAWFADVAYSLFGAPAILFPAMVMLAGWIIFNARTSPEPIDRTLMMTRTGGFLLTLASSCALATLHFDADGLPASAGGGFGELLGRGLAAGLGPLGATLLLLSVWLAAISLFTGLSWLAVMDRVGKAVLDGVDRGRQLLSDFRSRSEGQRAQEERQETVRKERRKVEKKIPPRIEPVITPAAPSVRAQKERQVPLFDATTAPGELPPLSLLDAPPEQPPGYSKESLEAMSRLVETQAQGLRRRGRGRCGAARSGRDALRAAPRRRASRSARSAISPRIWRARCRRSACASSRSFPASRWVSRFRTRSARSSRWARSSSSQAYEEMNSPLTLALGKDIGGKSVVADLQRMPHLLIAGTTGSGKSVGINAMVLSAALQGTSEHVRMIMIDPKMLELSVYEGIRTCWRRSSPT